MPAGLRWLKTPGDLVRLLCLGLRSRTSLAAENLVLRKHLAFYQERKVPTLFGNLWRYSADLIFLINNPAIREAFFPRDVARFYVERASAGDGAAIVQRDALPRGPAR